MGHGVVENRLGRVVRIRGDDKLERKGQWGGWARQDRDKKDGPGQTGSAPSRLG